MQIRRYRRFETIMAASRPLSLNYQKLEATTAEAVHQGQTYENTILYVFEIIDPAGSGPGSEPPFGFGSGRRL
jgi:hypothetical protein